MELLQHFSHEHLLSLVQLQPKQLNYNNEDSDKEDGSEDNDDFVVEELPHDIGKCKMCEEEIYSFHQCYYNCKDCDYSLHTFCAKLPTNQKNHPLHPGHNLTLSHGIKHPYFPEDQCVCHICGAHRTKFYNYHCSVCMFDMDITCAIISEQKMDHPSHPHQLQRLSPMTARCNACGDKHSGIFYHCSSCVLFMIHLNCALLPPKLLIQKFTSGSFSHPHLLTLAYSFPYSEQRAKFFPRCRVCDKRFSLSKWHYRCDKCRYYAHVDCATLTREAFMSSILLRAGLGNIYKNFKDEDYPNLTCCPFPDESSNLLKHHFINKCELRLREKIDGDMFSPHELILVETETLVNGLVSLHDPMKKVELLCDGCVRPITDVPFYMCSSHNECAFVLHEWCTRLPSQIEHYQGHPEHTLVLMPKNPDLGLFWCQICCLPCNGFAYGCKQCEYYVDINCGFIPDVITHEAHPNHLLLRFKPSSTDHIRRKCKACRYMLVEEFGFHCPTCDFYLHIECALFLPRMIRHKYDKHPLSLRYYPAENHQGEYFCEICEDVFDPKKWFYHCNTCVTSMHTACAPLKLQCEKSTYSKYNNSIFAYINVKFGGTFKFADHPHLVSFVQGIDDDGQCITCNQQLQYEMIFKCFTCKLACHINCEFV